MSKFLKAKIFFGAHPNTYQVVKIGKINFSNSETPRKIHFSKNEKYFPNIEIHFSIFKIWKNASRVFSLSRDKRILNPDTTQSNFPTGKSLSFKS